MGIKRQLEQPAFSLLSIFSLAVGRLLRLPFWALQSLNRGGWSVRRALVMLLFVPIFIVWQSLNWVFILLDELLFPSWRNTQIGKPWFIVGIPRSGTTFLQRSLAQDPSFTTTPLWEAVFAPSLSQKYLLWACAKGLSFLRFPVAKMHLPFMKKMSAIHELGLQEAEEDFLFLLPLNACFILVALVPDCVEIFKLARFDTDMSKGEKDRIIGFYRDCIKKHIYFRSRIEKVNQLIYLAKNPSMSPAVASLQQHFPEANFIVCVREPEKTLPSQISALKPAFALSGYHPSPAFIENCIAMLLFYYQHLYQELGEQPASVFVAMSTLNNDLYSFVSKTYALFNCKMNSDCEASLAKISQQSSQYRSKHRYQLSEFDLDEEEIRVRFKGVWPKVEI